jgi:uncharacterized membrane protein YobD (UPF0266 family)
MGLLTGYIIFSDPETTPLFNTVIAKAIFTGLFLFFAVLVYRLYVRFLRMEVDKQGIYMSNYFKTYRYPFNDIEQISQSRLIFSRILKIKMKDKTSLGRSFRVLHNKLYWQECLDNHPELKRKFST